MQRRSLILGGLCLPGAALAHHGWSSFDTDRPVWLEGRALQVSWRNPHAELVLEPTADLRLPADLATRDYPAQSARVDGRALGARATLPTRRDRRWTIELAPLSRLESWNAVPVRPGDTVGVLGFTFKEERGEAVLRAEYLFAGGKAYGLRSGPA